MEVGITFIYVTHDQEEAMTMSDRLAVMRHGKIEQIGGPEDVYESPATEFVAGFLGASNMLSGKISGTSGTVTTVRLDSGQEVRLLSSEIPSDVETEVKVGVRPEKITIEPDQGAAPVGVNCVSGLLRMSTYIGVSHQYKVGGSGGQGAHGLRAEPRHHQGARVRGRQYAWCGSPSTRSS